MTGLCPSSGMSERTLLPFLRSRNLYLGRGHRQQTYRGTNRWIISILCRAACNNAFMCRKTGPYAAPRAPLTRLVDLPPSMLYPFAAEYSTRIGMTSPNASILHPATGSWDAGERTIRGDARRCIATSEGDRKAKSEMEEKRVAGWAYSVNREIPRTILFCYRSLTCTVYRASFRDTEDFMGRDRWSLRNFWRCRSGQSWARQRSHRRRRRRRPRNRAAFTGDELVVHGDGTRNGRLENRSLYDSHAKRGSEWSRLRPSTR